MLILWKLQASFAADFVSQLRWFPLEAKIANKHLFELQFML